MGNTLCCAEGVEEPQAHKEDTSQPAPALAASSEAPDTGPPPWRPQQPTPAGLQALSFALCADSHTSVSASPFVALSDAGVHRALELRIPSFIRSTAEIFTEVELGPLLGRGAYGRVHMGLWRGADVAIKIVEFHTFGQRGGRKCGILEACLSKDLSFPSIVRTWDFAVRPMMEGWPQSKGSPPESKGSPPQSKGSSQQSKADVVELWIVQEFCDIGSLDEAVEWGLFRAADGGCNLRAVLLTLLEAAEAMRFLHQHGVLHADLTGRNVLLGSSSKDARGFSAKVADFGLSRVVGEGEDGPYCLQTHTCGTVTYQPPELLVHGHLSKAADVWAFGVLMWELFCEAKAYQGKRTSQVIHAVAVQQQRLPLPKEMPQGFADLLLRCMAHEAAARPTFNGIVRDLSALLSATG